MQGVAPKFVDKVLAVCDDEMIGDVGGLRILSEADSGMIGKLFKPVVALGIEKALGMPATDVSTAAAQVSSVLAGSSLVAPKLNLEADPYHAILDNLPLNTYKNKVRRNACAAPGAGGLDVRLPTSLPPFRASPTLPCACLTLGSSSLLAPLLPLLTLAPPLPALPAPRACRRRTLARSTR